MTEAEKKLWHKIRNKQLLAKFRRQQPIGNYIVDFVYFDKKLIIEIDGGHHFHREKDKTRDTWFENQGYKILRFWNSEVLKNIDGVIEIITREISPSPSSPPIEGGETDCSMHSFNRENKNEMHKGKN